MKCFLSPCLRNIDPDFTRPPGSLVDNVMSMFRVVYDASGISATKGPARWSEPMVKKTFLFACIWTFGVCSSFSRSRFDAWFKEYFSKSEEYKSDPSVFPPLQDVSVFDSYLFRPDDTDIRIEWRLWKNQRQLADESIGKKARSTATAATATIDAGAASQLSILSSACYASTIYQDGPSLLIPTNLGCAASFLQNCTLNMGDVASGTNLMIAGEPGSGKSSVIQELLFAQFDANFASFGISATADSLLRHSHFALATRWTCRLGDNPPRSFKDAIKQARHKAAPVLTEKRLSSLGVIIIEDVNISELPDEHRSCRETLRHLCEYKKVWDNSLGRWDEHKGLHCVLSTVGSTTGKLNERFVRHFLTMHCCPDELARVYSVAFQHKCPLLSIDICEDAFNLTKRIVESIRQFPLLLPSDDPTLFASEAFGAAALFTISVQQRSCMATVSQILQPWAFALHHLRTFVPDDAIRLWERLFTDYYCQHHSAGLRMAEVLEEIFTSGLLRSPSFGDIVKQERLKRPEKSGPATHKYSGFCKNTAGAHIALQSPENVKEEYLKALGSSDVENLHTVDIHSAYFWGDVQKLAAQYSPTGPLGMPCHTLLVGAPERILQEIVRASVRCVHAQYSYWRFPLVSAFDGDDSECPSGSDSRAVAIAHRLEAQFLSFVSQWCVADMAAVAAAVTHHSSPQNSLTNGIPIDIGSILEPQLSEENIEKGENAEQLHELARRFLPEEALREKLSGTYLQPSPVPAVLHIHVPTEGFVGRHFWTEFDEATRMVHSQILAWLLRVGFNPLQENSVRFAISQFLKYQAFVFTMASPASAHSCLIEVGGLPTLINRIRCMDASSTYYGYNHPRFERILGESCSAAVLAIFDNITSFVSGNTSTHVGIKEYISTVHYRTATVHAVMQLYHKGLARSTRRSESWAIQISRSLAQISASARKDGSAKLSQLRAASAKSPIAPASSREDDDDSAGSFDKLILRDAIATVALSRYISLLSEEQQLQTANFLNRELTSAGLENLPTGRIYLENFLLAAAHCFFDIQRPAVGAVSAASVATNHISTAFEPLLNMAAVVPEGSSLRKFLVVLLLNMLSGFHQGGMAVACLVDFSFVGASLLEFVFGMKIIDISRAALASISRTRVSVVAMPIVEALGGHADRSLEFDYSEEAAVVMFPAATSVVADLFTLGFLKYKLPTAPDISDAWHEHARHAQYVEGLDVFADEAQAFDSCEAIRQSANRVERLWNMFVKDIEKPVRVLKATFQSMEAIVTPPALLQHFWRELIALIRLAMCSGTYGTTKAALSEAVFAFLERLKARLSEKEAFGLEIGIAFNIYFDATPLPKDSFQKMLKLLISDGVRDCKGLMNVVVSRAKEKEDSDSDAESENEGSSEDDRDDGDSDSDGDDMEDIETQQLSPRSQDILKKCFLLLAPDTGAAAPAGAAPVKRRTSVRLAAFAASETILPHIAVNINAWASWICSNRDFDIPHSTSWLDKFAVIAEMKPKALSYHIRQEIYDNGLSLMLGKSAFATRLVVADISHPVTLTGKASGGASLEEVGQMPTITASTANHATSVCNHGALKLIRSSRGDFKPIAVAGWNVLGNCGSTGVPGLTKIPEYIWPGRPNALLRHLIRLHGYTSSLHSEKQAHPRHHEKEGHDVGAAEAEVKDSAATSHPDGATPLEQSAAAQGRTDADADVDTETKSAAVGLAAAESSSQAQTGLGLPCTIDSHAPASPAKVVILLSAAKRDSTATFSALSNLTEKEPCTYIIESPNMEHISISSGSGAIEVVTPLSWDSLTPQPEPSQLSAATLSAGDPHNLEVLQLPRAFRHADTVEARLAAMDLSTPHPDHYLLQLRRSLDTVSSLPLEAPAELHTVLQRLRWLLALFHTAVRVRLDDVAYVGEDVLQAAVRFMDHLFSALPPPVNPAAPVPLTDAALAEFCSIQTEKLGGYIVQCLYARCFSNALYDAALVATFTSYFTAKAADCTTAYTLQGLITLPDTLATEAITVFLTELRTTLRRNGSIVDLVGYTVGEANTYHHKRLLSVLRETLQYHEYRPVRWRKPLYHPTHFPSIAYDHSPQHILHDSTLLKQFQSKFQDLLERLPLPLALDSPSVLAKIEEKSVVKQASAAKKHISRGGEARRQGGKKAAKQITREFDPMWTYIISEVGFFNADLRHLGSTLRSLISAAEQSLTLQQYFAMYHVYACEDNPTNTFSIEELADVFDKLERGLVPRLWLKIDSPSAKHRHVGIHEWLDQLTQRSQMLAKWLEFGFPGLVTLHYLRSPATFLHAMKEYYSFKTDAPLERLYMQCTLLQYQESHEIDPSIMKAEERGCTVTFTDMELHNAVFKESSYSIQFIPPYSGGTLGQVRTHSRPLIVTRFVLL